MRSRKARIAGIIVGLLISTICAADEGQYLARFWTPEDAEIITKAKTDHHYVGVGGLKNYYASFLFAENSLATPLILVTGLEDPVPSWFDVVLRARSAGFRHVFIVELRGQGQSQRVSGNDKRLIHVHDFENYDRDFISALKDILKKYELSLSAYIVSHSTGSLVVGESIRLLSKEIPDFEVKAMAFWSPLILLNVSPYLNNFVVRPFLSFIESLYRSCCGLLVGRKYGPGVFEKSRLTTDPSKFELSEALRRRYGFGSSGVSLRWALNAISASRAFREQGLNSLEVPTLLVKAERDRVVRNDFEYSNKHIVEWTVPEAKHALHIERRSVFQTVTERTFEFLRAH